ncbi:MAG: dipeptidase PepE [Bacteroidota bacterium]|nr:dipeptidase PepE [Bacteroidota bacterium]
MRLLLISNSTNAGEGYLGHPLARIKEFLGDGHVKALFIPYAAVTFSYNDYELRVRDKFREIGHDIISIHHYTNPLNAVRSAPVIVVGGGNTWKLLKMLQDFRLIDPIRQKVLARTPYIGWSAGANVACPTIRTTNDMPVVEPASFKAFNLVSFQINPHYLDGNPDGHAGETREQRIEEFIDINRNVWVVGLREGTMLAVEEDRIVFTGHKKARIFRKNEEPLELGENDDFSFLFK